MRDVFNGAGVCGNIFAHRPIAPRGGLHQHTLFVAQGQRQPVDLGLGRIGQWRIRPQPKVLANPGVELSDFLGVKGIRLGPSLPAFLSPNVVKVLVENFDIKPIGDDGDLLSQTGVVDLHLAILQEPIEPLFQAFLGVNARARSELEGKRYGCFLCRFPVCFY